MRGHFPLLAHNQPPLYLIIYSISSLLTLSPLIIFTCIYISDVDKMLQIFKRTIKNVIRNTVFGIEIPGGLVRHVIGPTLIRFLAVAVDVAFRCQLGPLSISCRRRFARTGTALTIRHDRFA